jgi:hypothetical protein
MEATIPSTGKSDGLRLTTSLTPTLFDMILGPIQRQGLKQKWVFITG